MVCTIQDITERGDITVTSLPTTPGCFFHDLLQTPAWHVEPDMISRLPVSERLLVRRCQLLPDLFPRRV